MNRNNKEILIAVYSKTDINTIMRQIRDKLQLQNQFRSTNLSLDDVNIIQAKTFDALNRFMNITGADQDPPLIIGQCQRSNAQHLFQEFKHFGNYIEGDLVDFSKIKTKEKFFLVGNFLIFLAARYCLQNNITDRIRRVSFANCQLLNTILAKDLKKYFPKVEAVSFANNKLTNTRQFTTDIVYVFDDNDPRFTGIPLYEEVIPRPMNPSPYIWVDGVPLNAMSPLNVVGGSASGNQFNAEEVYQSYTPKVVDPAEDPIEEFLCGYVQSLQDNIDSIYRYYSQTAVFSMYVDDSAPTSPLQRYARFSRNIIKNPSPEFLCQGHNQINDAYNILFPYGIRSKVTELRTCELFKGLYAVVMSGILQNEFEELLIFDKTMSIGICDSRALIINDHLALREEK